MAEYLTAAWAEAPIDPLAEAAAEAGIAVRLAHAFTGAPDGEVRYTATAAGGTVTYEPGLAEDADVTLTDTYRNAVAMVAGELGPNAAFMRGQTKVVGATGTLLRALAAAGGEAYAEACERARSSR
ncbi:MAG: SCP2 sterol-binding domain-containing protein [Acidimicrobiales bacterium]